MGRASQEAITALWFLVRRYRGGRGTSVRFVLDITHGSIQKFGMQLTGVAGMGFDFQSYAAKEAFVNAHKIGELPIDMTLPIPVAGVPLALTMHTKFVLNTGYSARTSTLSATRDYSVTGQLFAGWQKNGPGIDPKLTPKAETDPGRTLDGTSVGINSMALGFMVQPMVGIGARYRCCIAGSLDVRCDARYHSLDLTSYSWSQSMLLHAGAAFLNVTIQVIEKLPDPCSMDSIFPTRPDSQYFAPLLFDWNAGEYCGNRRPAPR
jgi:hypothetical protein